MLASAIVVAVEPDKELGNRLDSNTAARRLGNVVAVVPVVECFVRHNVLIVKNIEQVTQHIC